MIDRIYRIIDGIIFVAVGLVILRVVVACTVLLMPENALHSDNADRVGEELGRVYFHGHSALISYLVDHAFYEEFYFRFLPILFVAKWISVNQESYCDISAIRTLWVVGASSVIFGWLHGGFWNIFVQGLYGGLFSLVFIYAINKMPAHFGRIRKSVVALGITTLVHAFSNYSIVVASMR